MGLPIAFAPNNLHKVIGLHSVVGDDLHLGAALQDPTIGMDEGRVAAVARQGDGHHAALVEHTHRLVQGHINARRVYGNY